MKIAFPTNNQKTIAGHIGLAKGFLIVDTNTGEKFYIENPVMKRIQEEHIKLNGDCGEHGLGTGRVVPPLLKEAGVGLFLAKEFGEGMLGNLEYEGIKTLVTDEKDIDTVLSQLKELLSGNLEQNRVNNRNFGYGYGRGRGLGRGQGIGRGLGFGRGQGLSRGMGRGFSRGAGFGRGRGNGGRFGFRGGWED
jgi:predicted Fe-Mo cluster-binding NifX family protein